MKYAISSCLMGVNCKYSGGNNGNEKLISFMKDKNYILVCPEVLGGLPTPRACSEIVNDKVINTLQEDVTAQFEKGAQLALDQILENQIDLVITQSRSPSCGKGIVYDGTFSKKLTKGNGKFVQLLLQHNIPVMDIEEFLTKIS
jgi:uncharacterized protein YbbK (DUF523 family)